MSDQVTLSKEAIREIVADGIREYEGRKGETRDRGNPEVGAVLRRHMNANRQTLRLLAEQSGVSSSMITKVISGTRMPSYEVLARWRRILGDPFLIEWFDTVERLDTMGRMVGDQAYATVTAPSGASYVIRQSTFNRLLTRCVNAEQRLYGERNEAKCRSHIDQMVRENYSKFGELVNEPRA